MNQGEYKVKNITVPTTEFKDGIIYFYIIVNTRDKSKVFKKRYSELLELHKTLVQKYLFLETFPPKIFFLTKAALEQRRKDLNIYFSKIKNNGMIVHLFPELKGDLLVEVPTEPISIQPKYQNQVFYSKRLSEYNKEDSFTKNDDMLEDLYKNVRNMKNIAVLMGKEINSQNKLLEDSSALLNERDYKINNLDNKLQNIVKK